MDYQTLTTQDKRQFKMKFKDIEFCNECDMNPMVESCNKCGEAVCMSETCCHLFPHKHDTVYVVCMGCTRDIESKLKVLIDHSHLKLLKMKIKLGKTRAHYVE